MTPAAAALLGYTRVNGVNYPPVVAKYIPRYYLPKPHLAKQKYLPSYVLQVFFRPESFTCLIGEDAFSSPPSPFRDAKASLARPASSLQIRTDSDAFDGPPTSRVFDAPPFLVRVPELATPPAALRMVLQEIGAQTSPDSAPSQTRPLATDPERESAIHRFVMQQLARFERADAQQREEISKVSRLRSRRRSSGAGRSPCPVNIPFGVPDVGSEPLLCLRPSDSFGNVVSISTAKGRSGLTTTTAAAARRLATPSRTRRGSVSADDLSATVRVGRRASFNPTDAAASTRAATPLAGAVKFPMEKQEEPPQRRRFMDDVVLQQQLKMPFQVVLSADPDDVRRMIRRERLATAERAAKALDDLQLMRSAAVAELEALRRDAEEETFRRSELRDATLRDTMRDATSTTSVEVQQWRREKQAAERREALEAQRVESALQREAARTLCLKRVEAATRAKVTCEFDEDSLRGDIVADEELHRSEHARLFGDALRGIAKSERVARRLRLVQQTPLV